MDEANDLKNIAICRVCMKCQDEKPHSSVSLFEEYNDYVISDKINVLTDVCIKEDDGLPDRICTTCLLELENAFQFKLKCENTNKILLSSVKKVLDDGVDPIKKEYTRDDDAEDNETQMESFDDIADPIKKEYEDDNIAFTEQNVTDDVSTIAQKTPLLRPSRALDLKLECHDCGESFKSKCKLRVHWNKVHLPEILKCPNCLKQFKKFPALRLHKKQHPKYCINPSQVRIEFEGKRRVFYCRVCKFKATDARRMNIHYVTHTGERPYQCDICLKTFTQRSAELAHKESFHKIYDKEGSCPHCGKFLQGRTRLNAHIRRHRLKKVTCKICDKVLHFHSMVNHMQTHSGIKKFICEICAKSFCTISALLTHRGVIHFKTVKKKDIKCEKCDYSSKSKNVMEKHKQKHSATNVSCGICGFFGDNEKQLVLHMIKHTDRKYNCSECEKTFYKREQLFQHRRKVHGINNDREPAVKKETKNIK